MNIRILAVFLYALFLSNTSFAEIISVPHNTDTPTATAYWPSTNAKAVIIFMPGGDGSFAIDRKEEFPPSQFFKNLFDKSQFKDQIDVVYVDSPYALGGRSVASRHLSDHLTRVEEVVVFYQNKLHKPIWLMGHSNGTISVSEFVNAKPENQKLLSGIILSGSRNEASLDKGVVMPIVFVHHQHDGCTYTQYDSAVSLYEKTKQNNSSRTVFKNIDGGSGAATDPCNGGHHMYKDAYIDLDKALEDVILSK